MLIATVQAPVLAGVPLRTKKSKGTASGQVAPFTVLLPVRELRPRVEVAEITGVQTEAEVGAVKAGLRPRHVAQAVLTKA